MDTNAIRGLEIYAAPVQEIPPRPIRILIADDYANLRQTLRQVLAQVPGVVLLTEGGHGPRPVESPESQADVVLSDVDSAAAISYYSGIREREGPGIR